MSRDLEKEYQTKFNTFSPNKITHSSGLVIFFVTLKVEYFFVSRNNEISISMFHRAFFNSIIDEYQHLHFFTFNTVLV